MKEIIRLTKLFINTNLGLSLIWYNKKHNRKAFFKQIGLPILVVVACLPAYSLYTIYMGLMYTGMVAIGQESVLLPLAFTMVSFLILFFGLAYIMSEFYFSGGIEMLLPLPIKPRSIIIGKFASVCLMEILLSFVLMLPTVVIYGVGQSMGVLYYLLAIVVIVLLPVLPLALITLVIMLIMRSNSMRGKKDAFQIVMLFLVLVVIMGGSLLMSQTASGVQGGSDQAVNMEVVTSMLSDNSMLLKTITQFYPLATLVAWTLNTTSFVSILSLLGFAAITAVAFLLMVLVGQKVYYKGLIAGTESGKRKQALTVTGVQKALSKRSAPALAIFKTDMRLLMRTPIYFFNNVSVVVIVPLVMMMSFYFANTGEDGNLFATAASFYAQYQDVFNFGLVALFMFFGGMATTTASTFSREGKNIWLSRIVPVKPMDQIIGRCLTALFVQLLGIACTLIICRFVIPFSLGTIVLSILLGALGSIPMLVFGLLIDMSRPLLNWDNPQKAVKNNMNIIITMFVGMVYILILLVLSGALGLFFTPIAGYTVFVVVSVAISIVLIRLANKRLESSLQGMNVDD